MSGKQHEQMFKLLNKKLQKLHGNISFLKVDV